MPQTPRVLNFKSTRTTEPLAGMGLSGTPLVTASPWDRAGRSDAATLPRFDAAVPSSMLMMLAEAVTAMKTLTTEIRLLREQLAGQHGEGDVIELREFSVEEGKAALLAWYRANPGEQYPSDAALAIGMDLVQARDLTDELVAEGQLA